jgi:hypothetical protein
MQPAAAVSTGHQSNAPAQPPDAAITKLREHQSAAARQPFADECRSLLRLWRTPPTLRRAFSVRSSA